VVTSGHLTKMTVRYIRKPHATRRLHGFMLYTEPELLPMEVSRYGNSLKGIFDLFCSCDFDLDSMTFIYELDPYSLEIYRICKWTSYVKAFESYRLTDREATDRQTDTTEVINLRWWSTNNPGNDTTLLGW